MKRLAAVIPLIVFLAACSGGPPPEPPAPPPLDPVGTYDCMAAVEGMEVALTLTITGEEGAYSGSVNSEMGPASVANIVVQGNEMTFTVDSPDMLVFFAVVFEGDSFTGEFDVDGMMGYISGKKR